MAFKRRQKLPGRKFLENRLMAAGLNRAVSQKAVAVLVSAMGEAMQQGGFELRGFAVMELREGARKVKRNPHTGQELRDNDGNPVYYTPKHVKVKLSSKGA